MYIHSQHIAILSNMNGCHIPDTISQAHDTSIIMLNNVFIIE